MKFIGSSTTVDFESYEAFGSGWLVYSPQAKEIKADGSLSIETTSRFTRRERTVQFSNLSENDYSSMVSFITGEINFGEKRFTFEDNNYRQWPVRLSITGFDFRESLQYTRRGEIRLLTQGEQTSGTQPSVLSFSDFSAANKCRYPSGITLINRHIEIPLSSGGTESMTWGRGPVKTLKLSFSPVVQVDIDGLLSWIESVAEWHKNSFSVSMPFYSGQCRIWSTQIDTRLSERHGMPFELELLIIE